MAIKYNIGDAVIGIRGTDIRAGILIERYNTVNGPYKNPAYRIRLQDGRLISYQFIQHTISFNRAMSQMKINQEVSK